MDMEDNTIINNDMTLDRLFKEASQVEIEDGGFTRVVMRRLPSRPERLSRIWTTVCTVVGFILLTYFKAWNFILDAAVNIVCIGHNIDWLHLLTVIILRPTLTMLVSCVFAYREYRLG